MTVRQITLDDLQAVSQLFDAYRVWYRMQSDIEGAKNFLRERIANTESIIYGAFSEEDEIAGFTQLYPLFSSTRMARLWLLNDLYVAEEYRGKGISIALIDRAKELARTTKAAGLILETETSNVIGNRLYPRTGFELDKHNHYYWENT